MKCYCSSPNRNLLPLSSLAQYTTSNAMIRSSLYRISSRYSPATLSAVSARPVIAVLSGKQLLSDRCHLSTNPKRDEALLSETYSDAFDDSDSLEIGKEVAAHLRDPVGTPKNEEEIDRYRPYRSPLSAPLFRVVDDVPGAAEEPIHTINIAQKPSLQEEVTQKNYSDVFDESDWAETGKIGHEKDA